MTEQKDKQSAKSVSQETSDDNYEFVSKETVQEILVWFYKVLLRISF